MTKQKKYFTLRIRLTRTKSILYYEGIVDGKRSWDTYTLCIWLSLMTLRYVGFNAAFNLDMISASTTGVSAVMELILFARLWRAPSFMNLFPSATSEIQEGVK